MLRTGVAVALGALLVFAGVAEWPAGPDTRTPRGTIEFGPVENPGMTPRVRVTNLEQEPVTIWSLTLADHRLRRLGTVPATTTRTFRLLGRGALRLFVRPASDTATFAADLTVLPTTDVALEVRPGLVGSTVVMDELEAVRERTRS